MFVNVNAILVFCTSPLTNESKDGIVYFAFDTFAAPIAQRIEHRPPEPGAQVRVLVGAPFLFLPHL